jgi:hypothetical protein
MIKKISAESTVGMEMNIITPKASVCSIIGMCSLFSQDFWTA